MSTGGVRSNDASGIANVDMKLEVVVLPVSDVDRAKEFYGRLGWRLDVTPPGVVQLTPPGSGCSVQFGPNLTSAAPALAARVKRVGEEFLGEQRELYLFDHEPGDDAPYERLLGDAMAGNPRLFTRKDSVEAAGRP